MKEKRKEGDREGWKEGGREGRKEGGGKEGTMAWTMFGCSWLCFAQSGQVYNRLIIALLFVSHSMSSTSARAEATLVPET